MKVLAQIPTKFLGISLPFPFFYKIVEIEVSDDGIPPESEDENG